jgi:hypothetical protein
LDKWQLIQDFLVAIQAGQQADTVINQSSDPELAQLVAKELCLLTAKPEIFVLNVDETAVAEPASIIAAYALKLGVNPNQIVVISAKIESEISILTLEDQQLYLADLGLTQSGLKDSRSSL